MKFLPDSPIRVKLGLAFLLICVFVSCSYPFPVKDTGDYLRFMHGFLREGFGYHLIREPAYPLFLALISRLGLSPERWISPIQNALFVAALYGFLRTLRGDRDSRQQSLLVALCVTLIPMYAVGINGAILTESVSATLILLFLSCCVHLYFAIAARRTGAVVAWSAGGLAASALLSLTKGSFIFIHIAFPVIALALVSLFWRRHVAWRAMFALTAILLVFGAAGRLTMSAWMGAQTGDGLLSGRVYLRAGSLFYGRVLYARDFDFLRQTGPFLLEAFSDSTCHRVLGDRCDEFTVYKEEARGVVWHIYNRRDGYTDEQLMAMGRQVARHSPIRQLAYMPYEWSRFVFHYGPGAFGRLQAPVLGSILNSGAFTVLLKIFNLALYFYIPIMLWRSRHQMGRFRSRLSRVPEAEFLGTLLAVAYGMSLLAVYGFALAAVRMIYPVAPLLVIINWQAWLFFRESRREVDARVV